MVHLGSNQEMGNTTKVIFVITAPYSPDKVIRLASGQRFLVYHAGGADLSNSFIPEGRRELKFENIILSAPDRVAVVLIRKISEKEGYVDIVGGGPIVRIVGDESQGLYTRYGPDVSDVSKVLWDKGLWGLKRFDEYDVEHGRRPLLGQLLAYNIVVASQYPRSEHTVLDHLERSDPYGVLMYVEDRISSMRVDIRKFVKLLSVKKEPRRLASVFRVIRPLKGTYDIESLHDKLRNMSI